MFSTTTKTSIFFLFLPALLLLSGCFGSTETERIPGVDKVKKEQGATTTGAKDTSSTEESRQEKGQWVAPLENVSQRVILKPFGIFVTPQHSPLERERFSGYHTGTDFEILEGEEDKEVPVKAVCSGELLQKRTASGYGGVAVQRCGAEEGVATVIYGHLDIGSVKFEKGENIEAGERLGVLGKGRSPETDGERKHLHLGLHRGEEVNIKGYVDFREELSSWLDPCEYVCK